MRKQTADAGKILLPATNSFRQFVCPTARVWLVVPFRHPKRKIFDPLHCMRKASLGAAVSPGQQIRSEQNADQCGGKQGRAAYLPI